MLTRDRLSGSLAAAASQHDLERERDELRAALELTSTAIVVSVPDAAEPRLNAAAQALLDEVVEPERHLRRLLARPGHDEPFARRSEVGLVTGGTGALHAASTAACGVLVTVLELQREQPGFSPAALAALTAREAEVAVLVADGLADREIADRLYLSHHTISQYVKRIYRKLDVDSRVALTRLLLGGRTQSLQLL
jgi:DNA-binding CsgD family transcriptional regulator